MLTPLAWSPGCFCVQLEGSQSAYLVDLNQDSLSCGCKDWDFRKRPAWEQLKEHNLVCSPDLYCKHMKYALQMLSQKLPYNCDKKQ